jgi:hypothetical protein
MLCNSYELRVAWGAWLGGGDGDGGGKPLGVCGKGGRRRRQQRWTMHRGCERCDKEDAVLKDDTAWRTKRAGESRRGGMTENGPYSDTSLQRLLGETSGPACGGGGGVEGEGGHTREESNILLSQNR